MKKLYIVVRADLEPGAQLAQLGHAVSAFAVLHPELHSAWFHGENNIVALAIPDEMALGALVRRCAAFPRAEVHEQDMDHQLTACAFSGDVERLVSSLPKALRPPRASRAMGAMAEPVI